MRLSWSCLVGLAALIACGGSSAGGGGADAALADAGPIGRADSGVLLGVTELMISPNPATIVIENNIPTNTTFAATAKFNDGRVEDVTNQITWSIDNIGLGTFKKNVLTSTTLAGGRTKVRLSIGQVEATADVVLQLKRSVNDKDSTGLPMAPGGKFGGTLDGSRKPNVVYPNSGVVIPPNLTRLEVHYEPAGNTLFEIAFKNSLIDVRVYARCPNPTGGGCIYRPDSDVWFWIAQTNRGDEPVAITVSGTDDAGSTVGVSDPVLMNIAYDDIDGGMYYWTTGRTDGNQKSRFMRFDFAGTAPVAEQYYTVDDLNDSRVKCIGCHAISPDGLKLNFASDGAHDAATGILDVKKAMPLVPFYVEQRTAFTSWNPDSTAYVGVYGGANDFNLLLVDGFTGIKTGRIEVGGTDINNAATHPDWSPDGKKIVFVRSGGDAVGMLQRFYQGSIEMVTKTDTGWSAPVKIVAKPPVGTNRYYPAFSPGGTLISFDQSHCGNDQNGFECDGDTDSSATMYVVKPEANGTPIALAHANAQGKKDTGSNITNTFPRWSPFVFHRNAPPSGGTVGTGKLLWITFSSTRNVGLRAAPPPGPGGTSGNTKGTLLWMAAIDPDAALNGRDPSFPAFYLPFQDPDTSNHIGQWTQKIHPVVQ